MKVFGISIVRNEVDIIGLNILHHLSLGLDEILIVDNGSSDGTTRVLQQLGMDGRIKWSRNAGPYRQPEIFTDLAREAYRRGADWVLPIDADEFWDATNRDLREVLERSNAGALRVQIVNFIQRREQRNTSPLALVHMTRRAPQPIGPVECCQDLVESHQIAYVEMMYPSKWISRACSTSEIKAGNHSVTGVEGACEDTDMIVCLHAPLRARSILDAKADTGRRADEAGYPPGEMWHLRRWDRLRDEGALEAEWSANSYARNHIDVYGTQRPLVFDSRLRDIAMRRIRPSLWGRLIDLAVKRWRR
jgi:glycosyltransferase involved in cell wall biosynthesis